MSHTPRAPRSLVILALFAASLPLYAQEETDPVAPERPDRAPRFRLELGVDGLLFDNFFQAPAGAEAETVTAVRGVGRLEIATDGGRGPTLVAEVGRTRYDSGLESATRLAGGLGLRRTHDSIDLLVGVESNRPVLDVGDELGTADVFFVDGEYGRRITADLELKGLLTVQKQSFAISALKDNTITGIGPALRFRGFGSAFSPEIGVLFGGRSATDRGEEHSQTDLYLQIRSTPSERTYVSLRLRRRIRDYSAEDAAHRNFGRQDRRNQLTGLLVYPTDAALGLSLYYAYQDAESTLASRTFDNHLAIVGLRIVLE